MAKKKATGKESAEVLSMEESMDELQLIVQALENGQEPLDASLQKFERGMVLLRSCHQQLDKAASRIEILTGIDADGNVTTAPFDGRATMSDSSPVDSPDDGKKTLF